MSGYYLGGHLGELEGDRLVLADNFPERTATSRVSHSELESAQGHPAAARRDVHPAHLDAVHELIEATPRRFPEDAAGRDSAVVQDQLGGVHALVAHLVDLAGNGQPGPDLAESRVLFDQE